MGKCSNADGIAVGSLPGESKDFVSYNLATGILTDIPVSFARGKPETYPTGITSKGEIVGTVGYVNNTPEDIGFVDRNGSISKLLPPNETQSSIASINKKGEILIDRGFVYYNPFVYKNGTFTQISVPGASITVGSFITDGGGIGGNFTTNNITAGFVLDGNVYTVYNPPGATYSDVTGIGPSEQVYGTFVDSAGNIHGFVNASGSFYQIDIPQSTGTEILGSMHPALSLVFTVIPRGRTAT